MNFNPTDVSRELKAIYAELQRLTENQMYTNRAVKTLHNDFGTAVRSLHNDLMPPKNERKPMSRIKRALMNLFLIIVFCVAIFFLFWAIRPASAQVAAYDALGCFTRTYDRTHLARHPDQIVTAVKLRIYKPPPDGGGKYWFAVQFKLRGQNKVLHASGLSHENLEDVPSERRNVPANAIHLFVECDGGGIDIVPRARGAMMYLNRISVAACGEEFNDGQEVTGGKDDRIFRLDRVNERNCKGMHE
jgi:hypothetical protein